MNTHTETQSTQSTQRDRTWCGARWAECLGEVLKRVYDPTTRTPVPWLLSGDVALALQGLTVEPEVIEFRTASPVATSYFAQLMRPYELPAHRAVMVYNCGRGSGHAAGNGANVGNGGSGNKVAPSENWLSNMHQRVVGWEAGGQTKWLGRWSVPCTAGDFTVQALCVRGVQADPTQLAFCAPSGASGSAGSTGAAGTDRAGRANVLVRRVPFGRSEVSEVSELAVAVVPLEYLLAECALRNDTHLCHRILHVMRTRGYSPTVLNAALQALPAQKASRVSRLLEMRLVAS